MEQESPVGKVMALDHSKSFLEDVIVEHGPTQLIGRLLLAADTAARERGVFLSFAPLSDLMQVNAVNISSWRPLLPIFDPSFGDFAAKDAFCLLGRNVSGDIVLTQAARFFDWRHTSFHDEATALRLFYGTPEARRRHDESCVVTAPAARRISGLVAYTGGHWCRPDYRSKGLPSITPRIARALAVTYWNVEYTCSLMAKEIFARGVAERAGYPFVEWSIKLFNSLIGTIDTALLWSDRERILADLEAYLDSIALDSSSSIQSRAQ